MRNRAQSYPDMSLTQWPTELLVFPPVGVDFEEGDAIIALEMIEPDAVKEMLLKKALMESD